MEDYRKRITLKFRVLSRFYDLFELAFMLAPSQNPRKALAGRIPNEHLRVLDVCTGTGNGAIPVAKENPRTSITGIDLSREMLAVAERKVKKGRIANISFQQMDATKMQFPNGRFDIAMVSFGLHELDYGLMMKTLLEMNRVLKVDGKFYIVDYEEEESLLKRILLSTWITLLEPEHMPEFLTYNWGDVLKDAGFSLDASDKHLFSRLMCGTKASTT